MTTPGAGMVTSTTEAAATPETTSAETSTRSTPPGVEAQATAAIVAGAPAPEAPAPEQQPENAGQYDEQTTTTAANVFREADPRDDAEPENTPDKPRWQVMSGECTTHDDGACLLSPHYPDNYADDGYCSMFRMGPRHPISVRDFSTEKDRDVLSVNGLPYSGEEGPNYIIPSSTLIWSTDGGFVDRGWKLCFDPIPEHAPRSAPASEGAEAEHGSDGAEHGERGGEGAEAEHGSDGAEHGERGGEGAEAEHGSDGAEHGERGGEDPTAWPHQSQPPVDMRAGIPAAQGRAFNDGGGGHFPWFTVLGMLLVAVPVAACFWVRQNKSVMRQISQLGWQGPTSYGRGYMDLDDL